MTCHVPSVTARTSDRVLTSLENLDNLEISGNFVTLENSGKTQGIWNVLREFLEPTTISDKNVGQWLVSENIRFMQIFVGVPLVGGVKRHSTLCKKYAKMTAMVILYIGFSLYNCREKTTQTVWKTWKTQGISFCQICKHPVWFCQLADIVRVTNFYIVLYCIVKTSASEPLDMAVSISWWGTAQSTKCHVGGYKEFWPVLWGCLGLTRVNF